MDTDNPTHAARKMLPRPRRMSGVFRRSVSLGVFAIVFHLLSVAAFVLQNLYLDWTIRPATLLRIALLAGLTGIVATFFWFATAITQRAVGHRMQWLVGGEKITAAGLTVLTILSVVVVAAALISLPDANSEYGY